MNAPITIENNVVDVTSLQAIEREVDRRFLPTIRAHQRTIKTWLATATDLELRDYAVALLLKIEWIAGQEETAHTAQSWSTTSDCEREAA